MSAPKGMAGVDRRGFFMGAAAASAMAAMPIRSFAQPRSDRPILLRGAYVITMGPGGDLPRADVLVRGGEIAAIGPALTAGDAEIVDAAGQILMPGLVDTHTHIWLSQMRGLFGRSLPGRIKKISDVPRFK